MSIAEKLTTVAQNQQKVYEAGKQAAYDCFWDYAQGYGAKTDYTKAFGSSFCDNNFRPKYSITPESANTMFASCRVTDLQAALERAGVTLDFSKVTNNRMVQFLQESSVTRIGVVDLSSLTNAIYVFFMATNLRTIEKLIFAETNIFDRTWFDGCVNLTNINRVEGVISNSISFHASPLSNDSVQNIIDHLKDLNGEAAQTLTLQAAVGAKLTDGQKAAIAAKNWTVVW